MKATTAVAIALLCLSRLPGLGRSLWLDEVYTAWAYVLRGPGTIRDGAAYIPNNHVLFSWLTWGTSTVLGMGEVVLRVWALVPGLVAAAWLVWWIGGRVPRTGWWVAAVATVLAAASPLHAMLVTEARGYGLVLLAATGTLIGGVEAVERARLRDDVVLAGSILVGLLTVPSFVVLAAVTAAVVLSGRRLHHLLRLAVLAAGVGAITLVWYRPMLARIVADTTGVGARWGEPATVLSPLVDTPGLLVTPSLGLLAGTSIATLLATVLLATGAVDLWQRDRWLSVTVAVVPAGSMLVLAAIGFHLLPRYVAYLLPHALVATAAGSVAAIDALARRSRPLASVVAGVALSIVFVGGWDAVGRAQTIPRQDFLGVSRIADAIAPVTTITGDDHVGLRYYLRSHDPQVVTAPAQLDALLCDAPGPVLYVAPVDGSGTDMSCFELAGFEVHRLAQDSAPGYLEIWHRP